MAGVTSEWMKPWSDAGLEPLVCRCPRPHLPTENLDPRSNIYFQMFILSHSFYFILCVYVVCLVYTCMCTCVITVQGPVCVRSEVNITYFPSHSLSCYYYDFLRQGLSLSLKLVDLLDWMTGLVLGGSSWLCLPVLGLQRGHQRALCS